MGVGLNTMLAAVGAGSVAASKISSSIGSQNNGTTAQSEDGNANAMASQKAMKNMQIKQQAEKAVRERTQIRRDQRAKTINGKPNDAGNQGTEAGQRFRNRRRNIMKKKPEVE